MQGILPMVCPGHGSQRLLLSSKFYPQRFGFRQVVFQPILKNESWKLLRRTGRFARGGIERISGSGMDAGHILGVFRLRASGSLGRPWNRGAALNMTGG